MDGHNSVGPRSSGLFDRAKQVFIDGTTRSTIDRHPIPRYVERGSGAYLIDVDGVQLLDLNGNFTTLIHGHGFQPVIEAVEKQIRLGTCFANPTEAEVELASLLCERVPGAETVRFVNTGTEAVLFAIKIARAYTMRPGIAKIEGAYHGAYDWVEVSQASTPANWGDPSDPASTPYYRGMPESVMKEVVPLRFNDADGAARALAQNADRLAAVVLDPMPSRAGLIKPDRAFIDAIMQTAKAHGILVIADEVLNFRQGYAGSAPLYGISPDIVTLGKIIGGGFPIGAIASTREIMGVLDASKGRPLLPQSGTFSANPVSMVAGLASMKALDRAAFARLDAMGERMRRGLIATIERSGAELSVTGAASLIRIHPARAEPREYRDTIRTPRQSASMAEMTRFFVERRLLFVDGSPLSLSTPMTDQDVDLVLSVFEDFVSTHAMLLEGISA